MCEISKEIVAAMPKGQSSVNTVIRNATSEKLPVGEELVSAVGETEMTLGEFLEYTGTPPDILLEKELVWPVEPDLTY